MEDEAKYGDDAAHCLHELRDRIRELVDIRLGLSRWKRRLARAGAEMELAAEEIDGAIDSLYSAEASVGKAHQHILVASHTMRRIGENALYAKQSPG